MQTVKMKLAELHKTEKNIRKHSEKQIREYVRSLEMFGQIRPLVVTEDGEILVGNGMYEALQSMGKEDCDVYIVTGLTEAQKRKLMLADNKVYELGITSLDALDDILPDLGDDFDVPGYDANLLELLVANPLDANKEIERYGQEKPQVTSENEDVVVQYSQVGESQYEPPVRSADGGFEPPVQREAESPAEKERDYIICPHCGEKIWL